MITDDASWYGSLSLSLSLSHSLSSHDACACSWNVVMTTIDKGSFIDMLKTGVGDVTARKADKKKVRL